MLLNRSSSASRKEKARNKKGLELEEIDFWKSESQKSFDNEKSSNNGLIGCNNSSNGNKSRNSESQSSFALAYRYSSSEEDEDGIGIGSRLVEDSNGTDTSSLSRTGYETPRAVSGPQVQVSTPNSLRLSRRTMASSTGGVRGG